jgi:hypothetical protein
VEAVTVAEAGGGEVAEAEAAGLAEVVVADDDEEDEEEGFGRLGRRSDEATRDALEDLGFGWRRV